MPFPWEATIPFFAISGFVYIAAEWMEFAQRLDNLGRYRRFNLTDWQTQQMYRDYRLTGHKRGQRDDPNPPEWFATNKGEPMLKDPQGIILDPHRWGAGTFPL